MFTVKYNTRLKSRVTHKKYAMGKVVLFDNSLKSTEYSIWELKRIFRQLDLAQNDEFLNARIIEETQRLNFFKPDKCYSEVLAVFDSQLVRNMFRKLVFTDKVNILEAFNLAIDSYLLDGPRDCFYPRTKEQFETLEFLRKRLLLRFESVLFQDKIKSINQDSVIVVNEFKKEYFLELPKHVNGMICKTTSNFNLTETYSNEYQFPIAIYNLDFMEGQHLIIDGYRQEIIMFANNIIWENYNVLLKNRNDYIDDKLDICLDQIKIYTSIPDNRDIRRISNSDWFNGICTFKSEFQYGVKGTITTLEKQTDIFVELLTVMNEKEVFINLLDFRPDKPVDMMEKLYTDVYCFLKYNDVFEINISAIVNAIKVTGKVPNIVIPMIRLKTEMHFWKLCVQAVFETLGIDAPPIGMMVETESTLEYFEDYEKQEFTIIGLDNLIEELMDGYNRYSNVDFDDFNFELVTDLRDLHQHYRTYHYKTRHIVSGHCLKNPKILTKLIKMGFKEFVIPIDYIPDVGEYIIEYVKTRGKYIGVAEERAEKKLKDTEEKEKKEAEKKKKEEKEKKDKEKTGENKKK